MRTPYNVIGESIKSAISIRLGEVFGTTVKRYKESITSMQYPNFFIYQMAVDITKDTLDTRRLNYQMNVRYRYVADIEETTTLEQQLDNIGLQFLADFKYITLGTRVYIIEPRYEKADGVLQIFFNIQLRVKEQITEEEKMWLLELNEKLKEEDK